MLELGAGVPPEVDLGQLAIKILGVDVLDQAVLEDAEKILRACWCARRRAPTSNL
jgi:hypothetical protein